MKRWWMCVSLTGVALTCILMSLPGYAASPQGELTVLVPTLGSEVWGPSIGSSLERYNLNITNEPLVKYSRDSQVEGYYPCLAEKWENSADGLTWDIYLRKGVAWHDGWGEFTAEDVVYTLNLMASPGSTSGEASRWRTGEKGKVESISIINPYQVRIKLKQPAVMMPWFLCHVDTTMVCKKYYEKVGIDEAIKHPIGTGSWRFVEHKSAEYVKYEAVENHWRKTPEFKYLIVKIVPEMSARMAMLKTGHANIVALPADKVNELEGTGVHFKNLPGNGFLAIQMGGNLLPSREGYDPTCPWAYHQDEPMDSNWNQKVLKVRKALFLAINKNAIIDKIYHGAAVPARLEAWPLGGKFSKPEWTPIPYDPEQAKQLLQEAGYAKGFEKPIIVDIIPLGGRPHLVDVGQAICNDWEAIGLQVKRNMTEWAVVRPFWAGRNSAWRVYIPAWGMEPEPWLPVLHTKNSKGGFLEGFESLDFDPLIEKCATEQDFEKRAEATRELGQYLVDHWIDCGILISSAIFAMGPKTGEWEIQRQSSHMRDYEYITQAK